MVESEFGSKQHESMEYGCKLSLQKLLYQAYNILIGRDSELVFFILNVSQNYYN